MVKANKAFNKENKKTQVQNPNEPMAELVPLVPGGTGNTQASPPKQSPIRKKHFGTWFYEGEPNSSIVPVVPWFREKAYKGIIQTEVAKTTGRLHCHLALWFKDKIRDTTFPTPKDIHWEAFHYTDEAVINYCRKTGEGGFDGRYRIEWGFPKPLKLITPDRPYQRQILDIVKEEPDDRSVYWFYEEKGGVGKSSLCKYLCSQCNALYIDEGKKSDLVNIIYNANMDKVRTVVVDVPRNNGNNVSYKAIEEIKNGMICNTKYETGMKLFNSPHIIIFSNYPPNTANLSLDRWRVYKINEDFTTYLCELE